MTSHITSQKNVQSGESLGTGPRAGFRADVFPQVRRAGVGTVLISEWDAGGPEGQRAVLDGVARAWEGAPLPAGFVSRVLFAGTDGRSVLDYAQWTGDAAHEEFMRGEDTGLREQIAGGAPAAVGDGGDTGPTRYRLYGSLLPQGEPEDPGCVVRVAFRTAGHEAARALVDGLLDLIGGVQPGEGGIASHFHISEDGTRVVNYSEWTTAEAHEREIAGSLTRGGPVMSFIEGLAGVKPLGFRRYVGPRGLVRV
ncbi:antibiotic biosynthesis monooxygenase [Streptomyces sp. NRRL S-337]|uniref:antibiotic biosynthesis monooxygenase n=1 Tax=Streptomyces sp. NRRL S-337 TaxID=1463900 RepID=UPI00099CCFD6|nr:antibiotic biosynthesis monooxygenase [Streptomyces sp. NRRL S-337]